MGNCIVTHPFFCGHNMLCPYVKNYFIIFFVTVLPFDCTATMYIPLG